MTDDLKVAADRWCESSGAHLDWPQGEPGDCPICGAAGRRFHQIPGSQPPKWACFSLKRHHAVGHLAPRGEVPVWWGDALDLEVLARGYAGDAAGRARVLRDDGYLTGSAAPARARRSPLPPPPPAPPPPEPPPVAGTVDLSRWRLEGTLWDRPNAGPGKRLAKTWPELTGLLADPVPLPGSPDDALDERKRKLPAWAAHTFDGAGGPYNRLILDGKSPAVHWITAIVLDLDAKPGAPPPECGDPTLTPDRLAELLEAVAPGAAWFAHTTTKSTPEIRRWRVVLPLAERMTRAWYRVLAGALRLRFLRAGSFAFEADQAKNVGPSPMWFVCSHRPESPGAFEAVEGGAHAIDGWAYVRAYAAGDGHDASGGPNADDASAPDDRYLSELRDRNANRAAELVARLARGETFDDAPPPVAPSPDAGPASDAAAAESARLVAHMHVRAVAARLVATLEDPRPPVYFGWPGGAETWPESGKGATIGRGEILPCSTAGRMKRGERWDALWRAIGPMYPDRVGVFIGRPGRGKSAFALQVAEAVATGGHPVLFASAEMGGDELVSRLLALRAVGPASDTEGWGIAWSAIQHRKAPADDLRAAVEALVEACPNLYVWCPKSNERTAEALQRRVELVVEANGGRPPFVVIDYLQRFAPDSDERGRREAVAAVSNVARAIARPGELGPTWPGAAVVALSSTARGYYDLYATIANLRDANEDDAIEGTGKETGEIEFDAPLLMGLTSQMGEPGRPGRAVLAVAKNRAGSREVKAVYLQWAPACGRFTEEPAQETARWAVNEASERAAQADATGKGKVKRKPTPAPPSDGWGDS